MQLQMDSGAKSANYSSLGSLDNRNNRTHLASTAFACQAHHYFVAIECGEQSGSRNHDVVFAFTGA